MENCNCKVERHLITFVVSGLTPTENEKLTAAVRASNCASKTEGHYGDLIIYAYIKFDDTIRTIENRIFEFVKDLFPDRKVAIGR